MSGTPSLVYSKRDVQQILAELKQQLPDITDKQWTDFLDSDLGYALLKSCVSVLDFTNFFTDQQVAESFLSLAVQRESIIRRAKELNYIPRRATPATVQIVIECPAYNEQITIPDNSTWNINGVSFVCTSAIVIPIGQTAIQATLTQGTPYTSTFTAPGTPWYRIIVPTSLANLEVAVNDVVWNAVDSWIGVASRQSYKIYEETTGQALMFGADLSTYMPKMGDTIDVTGIITDGAKGNIEPIDLPVTLTTIVRNGLNVDITSDFSASTMTSSLGGVNIETTESIQQNAPAFYATQGRCVTAQDYESVVRAMSGVTDVRVQGGEEINDYGKVHITVYGNDPYVVSDNFLETVYDNIKSLNMITLTPVVKAPQIIEIVLDITVGAKNNAQFTTASAVINSVNEKVVEFFENLQIGAHFYDSEFKALLTSVENIEYVNVTTSITGFANIAAGKLVIPLITNYDVSEATLKKVDGTVLFTGDATSAILNAAYTYTNAELSDQKLLLTYKTTNPNVLLLKSQVLVRKTTTITVVTI